MIFLSRLLACSLAILSAGPVLARAAPPDKEPAEKTLFDFEAPADLKAWTNLELVGAESKEPPVEISLSSEHAASGKHSLKITFGGGRWPAITTTNVPADWMPYRMFEADVTVSKPCLIGFRVLQEKSRRGGDWDGAVSRWVKTELLRPGKTEVKALLHPNDYSAIKAELGKVIRFEIFAYRPSKGETIYVDNIRLTDARVSLPPPVKTRFQVLGTDLTVANVQELSKKLANQWTKPEAKTAAQAEEAFKARYQELKKKHPRAVLAVLRDGEKGYDPAHPEKAYAGWKDAYWSSHGPDGMTIERATNYGKQATQEIFMRHRSPLFRVDLSSIPTGSNILAAELLIVRAAEFEKERNPLKPNMWVAEACNRPWQEYEVNAYEYARGKFWKAIGGTHWGEDADFLPLYVAHGPSQPGCCTWDFTHAVRFWTDGKHANHGFMLHGDSNDWFRAWFREAENLKDRPAVLIIYEPAS